MTEPPVPRAREMWNMPATCICYPGMCPQGCEPACIACFSQPLQQHDADGRVVWEGLEP